MKDSNNIKYLFMIHTAILLFGLAGVIGKGTALPAIILTFGRVFFSSIALSALAVAKRKNVRLKNKKELFLFVIAGIIMAIHWTSFMQSIKISSVAVGTITYSTFPLFVTFLEPIIYHEKLSIKNIILALIMLLGVFILVPVKANNEMLIYGILWGMCSSFTYAILSLMNRSFSARYEGTTICLYEQAIACFLLMPFIFTLNCSLSVKDIVLTAILGIVCTAIGHTLFVTSLKKLKVQTAGIISSMEPVYGIVLAMLILHDIPSINEIVGGCIVLSVALYSTISAERSQ